MSTIVQPRLQLVQNRNDQASVTFGVRFSSAELEGDAPRPWKNRFLPSFPDLGFKSSTYSAEIRFAVIRVVPKPFVRGTPEPSLPAPVVLQTKTVAVSVPRNGDRTDVTVTFTFGVIPRDRLVFDHIFATITLFRRMKISPVVNSFVTLPAGFGRTNDHVLELVTLANPQPNGTVIL